MRFLEMALAGVTCGDVVLTAFFMLICVCSAIWRIVPYNDA